jgi:acetolactate synthase-1/2/3 large subunit
VIAAFRYQYLFDNTHSNYIGDLGLGTNPALTERVKQADLLLVVGARLGEMTTSGYTLIDIPTPKQKLIHVYPGVEELGRVYQPTLAINASMPAVAVAARALAPIDSPEWKGSVKAARDDYLRHISVINGSGDVQLDEVLAWLSGHLPAESTVTNGAGNYTAWVHRFFQYRTFGSQLMTGQELATAVQYELNIIIVVVNNGMYGTIRMHQEREYPGRVIATDLRNPDFAALAKAYGAYGERVERTDDFPAAFERAVNAKRPALLELMVDPEAMTPNRTLTAIRNGAN